jgi:hypothetical protein
MLHKVCTLNAAESVARLFTRRIWAGLAARLYTFEIATLWDTAQPAAQYTCTTIPRQSLASMNSLLCTERLDACGRLTVLLVAGIAESDWRLESNQAAARRGVMGCAMGLRSAWI